MLTINVVDPAVWGVKAHGGELVINPDYSIQVPNAINVIDVENDPDGSCAGIGISCDGEVIHFFTADKVKEWPRDFFMNWQLVGHNVKYDVQKLRAWGFTVSPDQIVWDTQLAEYVKDSSKNRYKLKTIIKEKYGAYYPEFGELVGTGKKAVPISSLPVITVANYCGDDVLFTHKLMRDQVQGMTRTEAAYLETIELPAMRAILETEERGVLIDATYVRTLDKAFAEQVQSLKERLTERANGPLNPNSWQQVLALLTKKYKLRVPNTAEKTLLKHASNPFVKDLLDYRGVNKLRGTYTKPLTEGCPANAASYRLHARFNQTVAITGRLSSSEPNLQNIPVRSDEGAKIRDSFVAKEDHELYDVDYSQIQPSLMAHESQDAKMLEVFRTGKSIYSLVTDICQLTTELPDLTAKEIKAIAKILWLALAFNAGPYALSLQSGLTFNNCVKFIKRMEAELSGFFYWKDKTIKQAEIDGYVTTLFGRRIPIEREWAHLGPNYIIQGGESEIMKLAQAATRHLNPVLVVHDEVVFELPKGHKEAVEKEITELMSNVVTLSVPLRVEVSSGRTWLEAKG